MLQLVNVSIHHTMHSFPLWCHQCAFGITNRTLQVVVKLWALHACKDNSQSTLCMYTTWSWVWYRHENFLISHMVKLVFILVTNFLLFSIQWCLSQSDLCVCVWDAWCFHNPLNPDRDYRIFNMYYTIHIYIYVISLHA